MGIPKHTADKMLENKGITEGIANAPFMLKRQIQVLEIYRNFNTKNKHKMLPIPVFDVSSLPNDTL